MKQISRSNEPFLGNTFPGSTPNLSINACEARVADLRSRVVSSCARWAAGLLLLLAAFLPAGCKTDPDTTNSGQMASLEITGHSEVEILRAMKDVFESNGYEHMDGLTFDKKGSLLDTAAFGGWNSGGVWIRLKASVDPAPDGNAESYVIGCDAYRVVGRNEGVMEEEKKTPHSNRAECQRILEKIKERLASGAAAQPDQP
jgi:hypothetical protein